MERYIIPAILVTAIVSSYLKAKKNVSNKLKLDQKNDTANVIESNTIIRTNNNTIKEKSLTILYGTCTGTAENLANNLKTYLLSRFDITNITLKDANDFDDNDIEKQDILFIICSTYENGEPPARARRLYEWLQDYSTDFRVSKDHLSSLTYALFGLGGKIYGANFCKPVRHTHTYTPYNHINIFKCILTLLLYMI